ncbi:hypothetical protein HYC85_030512 [Camellia sinensis]|uniref:Uncharacterized protein n=1 Tax=Camellia sinensis TaxID=4442 RepID=A0A7J7G2L7_CAMSI|nr:hypothetical protein HYC85_030512 [Camellia sinensis]
MSTGYLQGAGAGAGTRTGTAARVPGTAKRVLVCRGYGLGTPGQKIKFQQQHLFTLKPSGNGDATRRRPPVSVLLRFFVFVFVFINNCWSSSSLFLSSSSLRSTILVEEIIDLCKCSRVSNNDIKKMLNEHFDMDMGIVEANFGPSLSLNFSGVHMLFEVGLSGDSVLCRMASYTGTPGVTGSVLWDSGVVLGKFLEHAVESGMMLLQGKKVVELGSGCGLVGCIAALLGAEVILTDLPDRLRLLRKNVGTNLYGNVRGSAAVSQFVWGEEPDLELIQPLPDYDAILEYFLESASKEFIIGRVDQTQWHPEYCSPRVVIYVLVKK